LIRSTNLTGVTWGRALACPGTAAHALLQRTLLRGSAGSGFRGGLGLRCPCYQT